MKVFIFLNKGKKPRGIISYNYKRDKSKRERRIVRGNAVENVKKLLCWRV
jgi:hypothetical protein